MCSSVTRQERETRDSRGERVITTEDNRNNATCRRREGEMEENKRKKEGNKKGNAGQTSPWAGATFPHAQEKARIWGGVETQRAHRIQSY